ncbi:MAG: chorismate synthase [Deferribacteraceae bacterium]|jgi:chorismate synthase|nr:chorismate synthase [Deferribacteraceae bacterium]
MNTIKINLFGESHGEAIGVLIDGLAPGIKIDLDFMRAQLDKRRAKGAISTPRHEADEPELISGFFNGHTTGTPLCIMIRNSAQHSGDYAATKDIPRPAHADYSAEKKYLGYQDYRGGGHFSGRLTAPLVAAGAICMQILASKGIHIGSHILQVANINDQAFSDDVSTLAAEIAALDKLYFPVLNEATGVAMVAAIEEAAKAQDSVGGIIESAVIGLPAGIGEPFFDSVESVLAKLLFSVPAVKGVEFGLGFGFAGLKGSEANDPFIAEAGEIRTATNNNGGLNGGITNGMPLKLRTVIKPTPSIGQPQQSVNMKTAEPVQLSIKGRHDPAIIHRARVVQDSMIAIGIVDLMTARFGYLWQL